MKPHLHPSSGGPGSGSSLMRHAGPRALMPTRRPTDVARSRRSLSNVTPHASAKKGQASVTPGTPPVGSSSPDAPSTSGSLASTPTPPMGWLWQVGKTPTAAATVADLKQDRIKPKKSLGQNFLTDDTILLDIVTAAGVGPGDLVLEVGPGTGNLTKHLLQRGARVTAVEKDDTLYGRLVEQYKLEPNLRIVRGDVLRSDLSRIIQDMLDQDRAQQQGQGQGQEQEQGQEAAQSNDGNGTSTSGSASASAGASPEASSAAAAEGGAAKGRVKAGGKAGAKAKGSGGSGAAQGGARKVKVVANLPYNITTEFLKLMLPMGELVSELSIMIQEEVAQRLVSRKPSRRDYRAMNLRVLYYSMPKYKFLIPKDRYYPAPEVDGALVTFQLLTPNARLSVPSERGFLNLVNKAFMERRKMMKNSVAPLYTEQQVESALTSSGLKPTTRAQDLSLEDFVKVHWALSKLVVEEAGLDIVVEDGE